jgi:hypothetical protein
MQRLVTIVAIAGLAGQAHADKHVAGYVAGGAGELRGRVVDDAGLPVRNAQVHVLSSTGSEVIVTTDDDGQYRAATRTDETYSVVYVLGNAKIGGSVVTTEAVDGNEVVEMHEVMPPAVPPVPTTNPAMILDYSDAAMDHDTWTRSWLLLDITEGGTVKRIKVLDRAGYDLDAIATRAAFKLKFEPARDRAKHVMPALVLWSFEWPAYWWLRKGHEGQMRRMPADAGAVPCKGTGPTNTVYRDCRSPSVANAISQPWIEKPK